MNSIKNVIQQMINISEKEWQDFSEKTETRNFKRNELLSSPGKVPHEIFFIEKGIVRVTITNKSGTEHTLHFALENQFIADYTSFLMQQVMGGMTAHQRISN